MKNLFFFLISVICLANSEDSLKIKPLIFNFQPSTNSDCDACGCATSASSMAFESLLSTKFIGVKYTNQQYKVRSTIFVSEPNENQYFNTVQLWTRFPIYKKLEIYGTIPFQFHHRENASKDEISGIGDASLLLIYKVLNSKNTFNKLNIGIGAKFPTGKFDVKNSTAVNPSFQVGTGSYDYQFALNYTFRKGRVAVLLNSDYTIKTENEKKYKFGNQFNYGMMSYYMFKNKGAFLFSGKMGISGENFDANRQLNEDLPHTKGQVLYGKTGFEMALKRFTFGFELALPIISDLANDEIKAASRTSLFLNFGL